MAIPASSEARGFYRCAFQRYEEAEVLFKAEYTTGAVYLAGYGIECILKALVLMSVPAAARTEMLRSFRGREGHSLESLRSRYRMNGGARFPGEITEHFTLVNDWSTDLRYTPRSVRRSEAEVFLQAAAAIIRWADGRR
jgi:HEPN domain-containing protein